jgi:hypothetical protein
MPTSKSSQFDSIKDCINGVQQEKLLEILNNYKKKLGADEFNKMINDEKLLVEIVSSKKDKEINFGMFENLLKMVDKDKIDFNVKNPSSGHSILRIALEKDQVEIARKLLFDYKADTGFLKVNGRSFAQIVFGGKVDNFNLTKVTDRIKDLIFENHMRSPHSQGDKSPSSSPSKVSAAIVFDVNKQAKTP